MAITLTVAEVAAFSGLEEKRVRKEVEYGVVGSRGSPPKFQFPALVYFRTLALLNLRLGIEDRKALYKTLKAATTSSSFPPRVELGEVIEVKVAATAKAVRDRLKRFGAWKAKLIEDDDILGGEPVFPKSRLAVRQVGGMLLKGADPKEVKADYPYLKDQDIEFAPVYTQAYPRVGRPRGRQAAAG